MVLVAIWAGSGSHLHLCPGRVTIVTHIGVRTGQDFEEAGARVP